MAQPIRLRIAIPTEDFVIAYDDVLAVEYCIPIANVQASDMTFFIG